MHASDDDDHDNFSGEHFDYGRRRTRATPDDVSIRGSAVIAFVHIAKTGGQTIETMLASTFGAGFCRAPEWGRDRRTETDARGFVVSKYGPDDLRRLRRLCPWLRCVGGHPVALWSDFGAVAPTTWFTFLREPLARGASHFQYNLRDPTGRARRWDEWVQWPVHQDHQLKMLSPVADVDDAIARIVRDRVFVGLTEHFDESLILLKRLVLPQLNIAYRRTNTAEDPAPANAMLADPAVVGELERMYAKEIALYRWVREEWYPRFQREYGPTLTADVAAFRRDHGCGFNRVNHLLSRLNQRLLLRPAAYACTVRA